MTVHEKRKSYDGTFEKRGLRPLKPSAPIGATTQRNIPVGRQEIDRDQTERGASKGKKKD
jgi:hypothetical protein